jgi:DNA-binding NarL/FixJ family response regulator
MTNLYSPIKIILADDHEVVRDGFQVMLKKENDIEIIGEAKNGEQLIRLAGQLRPDIIITDIMMPEKSGIEATAEITNLYPEIGVIAFSMYNDESLVMDMLKAGAKGYLLKSSGKEEVITAVKTVYKGDVYYCRETAGILSSIRNRNESWKPKFTDREIMIIRLICKELSNQEIADLMNLSRRTIEGYRENIIQKTRARNTAGIVLYAIKNKIFQYRK